MATPVGHYLLGLSVAYAFTGDKSERKRAVALGALAIVPDLDILPGLLVGNLGQFHHGATHSLTAAVIFGVAGVLGLVWWRKWRSVRFLVLLPLIYLSHIALDFVTLDTGAPYGMPLFWPWSSQTFESPWMLLPNVQHTSQPLISWHNVLLGVQEALVFLPLLGLVHSLKGWQPRLPRASAWVLGGWLAVAVVVSVFWLGSFT